ncbi:MAG: hypothetical protein Q8P35_01865 [Candidatus Yanofskybacteria bacterium]|nr:hypothetical protein [Candidatus Yanofskybacteria bacterium]
MEQNIEKILQELYAIDGSLKSHESELRQVIRAFMVNRPDISMDPAFQSELRKHITERIASIQKAQYIQPKKLLFDMKNFNFKLGTAVIGLILAVPMLYYANERGYFGVSNERLSLNTEISPVGNRAFGALNGDGVAVGLGMGSGAGLGGNSSFRSQSGGGGGDITIAPVPEGSIMPSEYFIFKYVYKGEDITLEDTEVSVLRRVKGPGALGQLDSFLGRLDLDSIDLSRFKDLKLNNVNLQEEGQNGFNIYVDLVEGAISLNKYIDYGPQYVQPPQLKETDIPADDVIINIARDFLNQYGIDTDAFRTPEIGDDWRIYYARASEIERSRFYIPDVMAVIFPLQVNGQRAYEEGGQSAGLFVQVNVRDKTAIGLWNLTPQKYESSAYKAVTDVNKVLAAVERGTFRNWGQPEPFVGPNQPQPQIREVEVGTPSRGYIKMWNYASGGNQELLVPALIFPITKLPTAEYFYQRNIIIPLAEDLFQNNDGGPIKIMEGAPRG